MAAPGEERQCGSDVHIVEKETACTPKGMQAAIE